MVYTLELTYKNGVVESYNTVETESAKKAFFNFKHSLSTNGFNFMADNMPVKVSLVDGKGFVVDVFCSDPDEDPAIAKAKAIGSINDILYQNLHKCAGREYYGRIVDRVQEFVVGECLNKCQGDYQSITEDDVANAIGKVILNMLEEKEKYDWDIPFLKRDLNALLTLLQKDPLVYRDICKKLNCMKTLEEFIGKDFKNE
jgi:hypothetical protein